MAKKSISTMESETNRSILYIMYIPLTLPTLHGLFAHTRRYCPRCCPYQLIEFLKILTKKSQRSLWLFLCVFRFLISFLELKLAIAYTSGAVQKSCSFFLFQASKSQLRYTDEDHSVVIGAV